MFVVSTRCGLLVPCFGLPCALRSVSSIVPLLPAGMYILLEADLAGGALHISELPVVCMRMRRCVWQARLEWSNHQLHQLALALLLLLYAGTSAVKQQQQQPSPRSAWSKYSRMTYTQPLVCNSRSHLHN